MYVRGLGLVVIFIRKECFGFVVCFWVVCELVWLVLWLVLRRGD